MKKPPNPRRQTTIYILSSVALSPFHSPGHRIAIKSPVKLSRHGPTGPKPDADLEFRLPSQGGDGRLPAEGVCLKRPVPPPATGDGLGRQPRPELEKQEGRDDVIGFLHHRQHGAGEWLAPALEPATKLLRHVSTPAPAGYPGRGRGTGFFLQGTIGLISQSGIVWGAN